MNKLFQQIRYLVIALMIFALIGLPTITLAAAIAPPQQIVVHRTIIGEPRGNIYNSYMKPKNPMQLFLTPDKNSEPVTLLQSGDFAKVIDTEVHSNPEKGKAVVISAIPTNSNNQNKRMPSPGENIYILFYIGEGYYSAWYDNQILIVPENGIKGNGFRQWLGNSAYWAEFQGTDYKNRETELWICLKTKDGLEGWVKFEKRDDWYTSVGSVFISQ